MVALPLLSRSESPCETQTMSREACCTCKASILIGSEQVRGRYPRPSFGARCGKPCSRRREEAVGSVVCAVRRGPAR